MKRRLLGTVKYVCSTVLLALLANWISNGFHLPRSSTVMFVIICIATVLSLLALEFPRLFHHSTLITQGWSTTRRSALICTISDRPGASDELIPIIVEQLQKQGPITCLGLVGTTETQTAATQQAIVNGLRNVHDLKTKEVACDPFDLKDVQAMTQGLIKWAESSCNIPAYQILIDVTGGTAVMTLGAYLAAQEAGVDIEYVATPRTAGQKADMRGRHPVIVSRGGNSSAQFQHSVPGA